jgi:hypothetical protein
MGLLKRFSPLPDFRLSFGFTWLYLIAVVLVTQDQEDTHEVADRVTILNRGSLVQFGTQQQTSISSSVWLRKTGQLIWLRSNL